jgi:D-tyrosyl-tRNA(Tyr) deacylase
LCVLLGVARGDAAAAAERLAGKVARLRIFENDEGKFDRSLLDTGGAALVVSQFTLIADSRRQKGTRPDFSMAAPKDEAEPIYEAFCDALRALGIEVATGVFGARMRLRARQRRARDDRARVIRRRPAAGFHRVPTFPVASERAGCSYGQAAKEHRGRTRGPVGRRS